MRGIAATFDRRWSERAHWLNDASAAVAAYSLCLKTQS